MEIVKISAIWCPSCIIMNDIVKEVSDELNILLTEYDYDMDEDIVKNYNPGKILPVMIFMENGQELFRMIGENSKTKLIQRIEEVSRKWKNGLT